MYPVGDVLSVSGKGPDQDTLIHAIEESRRNFDKQVAELEQLDDKAMRTVRTAILLIGFLVSAVGIAGPSAFTEIGIVPSLLVGIGAFALFASALVGVGTYSTSDFPTGVGDQHRSLARQAPIEAWHDAMLNEYGSWSDELAAEIEVNSAYLDLCLSSLLFGASTLLFAAVLTVAKLAYGFTPWRVAAGGFLVLAALLLPLRLRGWM